MCRAEDWTIGRKALMREIRLLGPLPDQFAPRPAPTHRWLPADPTGACAEISLHAEEAAAA